GRQAAEATHPIYLRSGKRPMPVLSGEVPCVFGKGRGLEEGKDIAMVTTGELLRPALEAAARLKESQGIAATVVSMHTVKPLDTDLLTKLAATGMPILTVEEHSVYGGLGEACASFLLQAGFSNRFQIMAIPDEYTVT